MTNVSQVFNVADEGAVPNDGKDDRAAIEKTIAKAEAAAEGGIVFFPPGVWCVGCGQNQSTINSNSITISKPKVVLRGSGASKSTIWMPFHFNSKTVRVREMSG